jgi:2-polyprenyl-6-methoxyphenol hydroxylase-like FAD-dependent oxidoreductase
MASLENRKGFRVIIVGGSVSGLTLANALDRAGIDFVVLEKQNDITVQNGASIVVFPNGFAALEQLGLYEDIAKLTLPITKHNARAGPDARLFWQFDGFYLQSKR